MKKTLGVALVVALLITTLSIAVKAAGRGPGNGPNGNGCGFYNNSLNLTTDQQQKILALRQDFQKDTLTLRFDLQKKNLELRQLWAEKPANQNAIDAKTKEVTALTIQMNNKLQSMQDKFKTILTPEQLKQLNNSGFGNGPGFGGQGRRGGGGGGCMGGNFGR